MFLKRLSFDGLENTKAAPQVNKYFVFFAVPAGGWTVSARRVRFDSVCLRKKCERGVFFYSVFVGKAGH